MKHFGGFRHGTTGSSDHERQRAHSEQGKALETGLRDLRPTSMQGDGSVVKGNAREHVTKVTFKKADTPTFAAHPFGHTVYNWHASDKMGKGDITRCTRPGYRPDRNGIWLECDNAPVTASIKMWGERGSEPPSGNAA